MSNLRTFFDFLNRVACRFLQLPYSIAYIIPDAEMYLLDGILDRLKQVAHMFGWCQHIESCLVNPDVERSVETYRLAIDMHYRIRLWQHYPDVLRAEGRDMRIVVEVS